MPKSGEIKSPTPILSKIDKSSFQSAILASILQPNSTESGKAERIESTSLMEMNLRIFDIKSPAFTREPANASFIISERAS